MPFPRIMLPAAVALTMACGADTVAPTAPVRPRSAPSSAVVTGPTVHLISLGFPYEVGATLIVIAFEPYPEPIIRSGIPYVGNVRTLQTGDGGPGQILFSDTALQPGTMLTTTTTAFYPSAFEATVVLHGPPN